ncbi:DNA-binding transcriptional repressor DeoR [Pseudomonas sp. Bout1]|uniref:DNA-binding transcriptional repressor DeoR n=1 Tax=Pseudomonas sp. Bout1 TaxID=3048600 RepID=UPI002AB47A6E|nr:DNA-binding transcriptional repressor DeoR [Pseudomonas sp. Bout1]MDY7533012.1 DNA-binding transcriptional repressor DeoR [Pseudomonas sp. Bout1]MEB0185915.1 DNA-binding transcriptional repressor DeoR [Pseudomonas sp. Bout1]
MDSKKSERFRAMHKALQGESAIHLRDMAAVLGVSEMTLRRDLADNPQGLRLLGGHVTRSGPPEPDYQVAEQDQRHVAEKRQIGALAASLVRPGDTVFIDCGTTTPFIIEALPDDLEFTALCNSLNVLLKLQQKPHCTIILCGGTFHRRNMVFESHAEAGILDGIRVAWAFISAAGVSAAHGVTCYNLNEVEVKRRVMARAQTCVLVADHSKFDEVRAAHFAELSDFQRVISDPGLEAAQQQVIKDSGAILLI